MKQGAVWPTGKTKMQMTRFHAFQIFKASLPIFSFEEVPPLVKIIRPTAFQPFPFSDSTNPRNNPKSANQHETHPFCPATGVQCPPHMWHVSQCLVSNCLNHKCAVWSFLGSSLPISVKSLTFQPSLQLRFLLWRQLNLLLVLAGCMRCRSQGPLHVVPRSDVLLLCHRWDHLLP